MSDDRSPSSYGGAAGGFTTTHWSVVLAAGERGGGPESAAALERLCRTYWRPLYLYVRRRGHSPEEAQDLTQEFFRHFLGNNAVERADRARGRFRTFLLCSLQNFLANEWRKAKTIKRGGAQPLFSLDGVEAGAAECHYQTSGVEQLTPERAYEKSWAVATLEEAMLKLEKAYESSGKGELFEKLRLLLWDDPESETYAALGRQLGMSEGAVKMAVSRLRQRAREILREEIANTVSTPDDVEDELRYLIAVLRG